MKNHSVTSVSSPVDKVQYTPGQLTISGPTLSKIIQERDKLKAINANLLEALQDIILDHLDNNSVSQASINKARAAIAKATQ